MAASPAFERIERMLNGAFGKDFQRIRSNRRYSGCCIRSIATVVMQILVFAERFVTRSGDPGMVHARHSCIRTDPAISGMHSNDRCQVKR